MPYKTDKLSIKDPFLDRRVKLLPCEKDEIKKLHKEGASIHSLARSYDVCRRTIGFIVYPERKKRDLELRRDRGGSMAYYKKEKHAAYMRGHRKHKQKVLAYRLGK